MGIDCQDWLQHLASTSSPWTYNTDRQTQLRQQLGQSLGTTNVGDAGVLENMRRDAQQGPRIEYHLGDLHIMGPDGWASLAQIGPTTPPASVESHTREGWGIVGGLALFVATVAYPLVLCWVVSG